MLSQKTKAVAVVKEGTTSFLPEAGTRKAWKRSVDVLGSHCATETRLTANP